MKALTLHAPWGWAIAHLGKDVENRGWKPPVFIIGQRIAIHQGKKWDELAWMTFRDAGEPNARRFSDPGDQPLGAIVATTVVAGWYDVRDGSSFFVRNAKAALPAAVQCSPWLFGHIGWWLEDTRALPKPIPCKGAQGLWNVPADVLAQMSELQP